MGIKRRTVAGPVAQARAAAPCATHNRLLGARPCFRRTMAEAPPKPVPNSGIANVVSYYSS
jgi:hypothetical protein